MSVPIQETLFAQNSIKTLTADDFTLESKELLALKYSDCILVLFYNTSQESSDILTVWQSVSAKVAGPVFCVCNLDIEVNVAAAFPKLAQSHPFHWLAPAKAPFIVVYRAGWPLAYYNGPKKEQELIDFALKQACSDNFYNEQL